MLKVVLLERGLPTKEPQIGGSFLVVVVLENRKLKSAEIVRDLGEAKTTVATV